MLYSPEVEPNLSSPLQNPIAAVPIPIMMVLKRVFLKCHWFFFYFNRSSPLEACSGCPCVGNGTGGSHGCTLLPCASRPKYRALRRHTNPMLTFPCLFLPRCFQHSCKGSLFSQDAVPPALFFRLKCLLPFSWFFTDLFFTSPLNPLHCPHSHKALITQHYNVLSLPCRSRTHFYILCA